MTMINIMMIRNKVVAILHNYYSYYMTIKEELLLLKIRQYLSSV